MDRRQTFVQRATWRRVTVAIALLAVSMLYASQHDAMANAANPKVLTPQIVARAGSSNVLYVLWTTPMCSARGCTRLERSTNGGQSFSTVSVPALTPVHRYTGPLISHLYFANPLDGYALEYSSVGPTWDTSTVFSTMNGGLSWQKELITPHAYVSGFASSGQHFYAITARCPSKARKCTHWQLDRSAVSSRTWISLPLPARLAAFNGSLDMAAYGDRVWLTTQEQSKSPYSPLLATSHDAGQSFTVTVQPDLTSVNECTLVPASSAVIWGACDQGMMRGDIVYSSDGGTRWVEDRTAQFGRFGFGVFDPLSFDVAYFINELHANTLYRTANETATPHVVGVVPKYRDFLSLDFANEVDGLALSQGPGGSNAYILWRTSDGGSQWSRVSS
jgi:hypothetical protein